MDRLLLLERRNRGGGTNMKYKLFQNPEYWIATCPSILTIWWQFEVLKNQNRVSYCISCPCTKLVSKQSHHKNYLIQEKFLPFPREHGTIQNFCIKTDTQTWTRKQIMTPGTPHYTAIHIRHPHQLFRQTSSEQNDRHLAWCHDKKELLYNLVVDFTVRHKNGLAKLPKRQKFGITNYV